MYDTNHQNELLMIQNKVYALERTNVTVTKTMMSSNVNVTRYLHGALSLPTAEDPPKHDGSYRAPPAEAGSAASIFERGQKT